jgi:ABC-2 type transport system ATP-binding protein
VTTRERAAVPPVITVEHLRKVYGHRLVAVDDISFDVERGEIFGLLGSNGAGKTTTVECVQGLRTPTAGAVRVLGKDPLAHAGDLRGRLGCQLQESRLPDHMKVWEALDLFASLTPGAADWETLLDQWGLAEKRGASFSSLSGGQRQRLFIALALVSDPEVVFLDEMTTGLDPAARRVAWDLIERIRDRGTTVVLVTHFMDEAERLCDRVAVVDEGSIVALDSPRGLVVRYDPLEQVVFSHAEGDIDWLRGVPGAQTVTRRGRRVVVQGTGPLLAYVGAALVERGLAPEDLRVIEPSLEDVFLKLTGHLVED